jgi:hypothetical protein
LPEVVPEVLRLDGDLLWSNEFFDRPDSITRFYATWLNIAAAIAENGFSLVFCGAVAPHQTPEETTRAVADWIRSKLQR